MELKELLKKPDVKHTEIDIYDITEILENYTGNELSYDVICRIGEESSETSKAIMKNLSLKRIGFSNYDGERTATMGILFYRKKPVLLYRQAGRGERDFEESYILDAGAYKRMVKYLFNLYIQNVTIEEDELPKNINEFYRYDVWED